MMMASLSTSSAKPPVTPDWRNWLATAFSFPVMCMSLLAAAIFRYCTQNIAEPDIWWHLRNARTLFEHHSLSPVDTYSFTAAGSPWMNFEWLSEVPYFLAFRSAGLQGVLLVYFIVLVLIFAAVYYRCCRAGADCKDAAIATLGAVCLGGVSMAPRTLLFGWLCMVALLLVLDQFRRAGRGLWLAPPIFALWINLHGSWVFGIVVFVIVICSGLVEGERGAVVARRWTPRELTNLLASFVASAAALFINPFGYKLVLYPFDLLLRHSEVTQYLDEWQSVDFGNWNGKLALIIIFGLIAAALFSRRPWRLDDLLLVAFAMWAALSHQRFLFFAGLILPPVLAPRLHLFPPYERELDKPWLNAIIIAGVIGSLIYFFPSEATLQARVNEEYPRLALNFMEQQHLAGRIFNDYGWGGYIEWNAPQFKPFIDGRADIFAYNGTFADDKSAVTMNRSFEVFDKYKVDYILLKRKQPLSYLLEHSAAWNLVYSDNIALLFERAEEIQRTISKNQALTKRLG